MSRLVPLLCPGGTAVCLASGPSLTGADVAYVRNRATVIAINDAIRLAPWADVFYSGAREYWTRTERGALVRAFRGLKVRLCLDADGAHLNADGIVCLRNTGVQGLECAPTGLRHYQNSGGAAINLAVHLGAARVVLLGYDMGPSNGRHHFHETAPTPHGSPYALFRQLIGSMVGPLARAGVEVVNCSRQSALTCFPRARLEDVLP
jgi:hypothetical protein